MSEREQIILAWLDAHIQRATDDLNSALDTGMPFVAQFSAYLRGWLLTERDHAARPAPQPGDEGVHGE